MASLTKQRKKVIKRKVRTRGKERKRKLVNGSTPRFPVHLEDGDSAKTPQPPGSHPNE